MTKLCRDFHSGYDIVIHLIIREPVLKYNIFLGMESS